MCDPPQFSVPLGHPGNDHPCLTYTETQWHKTVPQAEEEKQLPPSPMLGWLHAPCLSAPVTPKRHVSEDRWTPTLRKHMEQLPSSGVRPASWLPWSMTWSRVPDLYRSPRGPSS